MKKKFAILSVLLIVALTLGACANTGGNNQTKGPARKPGTTLQRQTPG